MIPAQTFTIRITPVDRTSLPAAESIEGILAGALAREGLKLDIVAFTRNTRDTPTTTEGKP